MEIGVRPRASGAQDARSRWSSPRRAGALVVACLAITSVAVGSGVRRDLSLRELIRYLTASRVALREHRRHARALSRRR